MEDPIEDIITISLDPIEFPESFTNAFPGRPRRLHQHLVIRKDSDIITMIPNVVGPGQTREGHRRQDPNKTPLYSLFNLNDQPQYLRDTNCNQSQHTVGCFFAGGSLQKYINVPKPNYRKGDHTEYDFMKQMNDYLKEEWHERKPERGRIFLYSPNSPCMKRKKGKKDPCMFRLLEIAKLWEVKYGIFTIVFFTKFWGPIGSHCSEDFERIVDRFARRNKEFQIKLANGRLTTMFEHKYKNDFFSFAPDIKDRNNLIKEFQNVIEALESLPKEKKSLTTHLDEGQRVIESLKYPELREKVFDIWQEEVKRQEKEAIVKEMTPNLNYQLVKSFLQNLDSILGEGSPIDFYQIPPKLDLEFIINKMLHLARGQTDRFQLVQINADDTQLYWSIKPDQCNQLTKLQAGLKDITWMTRNFLLLNSDKTEVLMLGPKHLRDTLSNDIAALDNLALAFNETVRILGVIFDPDLSFNSHLKIISRNAFFHLSNISKIRHVFSQKDAEKLVHAFVTSSLVYCDSLLSGSSSKSLKTLQLIARVLTKTRKREYISPVLTSLYWLPVKSRKEFKILLLTFKALNNMVPLYLNKLSKFRLTCRP